MARLANPNSKGGATKQPVDTWATGKVGSTGKTQAQIDADAGQVEAEAIRANAEAVKKAAKDAADKKIAKDAVDAYKAANPVVTQLPFNPATPVVTQNLPFNGVTPEIQNLQNQFNDFLTQQNAANTAANAEKLAKRQSAVAIMTDRLKQYKLESLAPLMLNLAQEDASEDTIMLVLQEAPEYKERFKANQTRIAKNLAVLTPREYLTLEDTYRQVLRSSGLTQFDNDTYVSQFIGNDMSPNELVSRVDLAVQRVKNSDPETLRALTDYYGFSSTDLYGYMLDPKQQMPALIRKVESAEIGGAARRAGIDVKAGNAEELAAQGINLDQARRGFTEVSQMRELGQELPGDTSGSLTQQGLIDATFQSNADSITALKKVRGRRVAEFQAGGEFAASQTGVSGLGSATRGT